MEYASIIVERAGAVGIVTLNRPEVLNAINIRMRAELADAMKELEADENVRVIVFTGAGRAFSAGGDIHEQVEYADVSSEEWKRWGASAPDAFNAVALCSKPTIGAMNGLAYGAAAMMSRSCSKIPD